MGARVIAVSDVEGGIRNDDGLDIDALVELTGGGDSVVAWEDGHRISNDELLTLDVDVLVPAALGGVIDR
ncbi:MAG: glutamate dehydrogenase, partial [Gemmatimonadetes bacterium]|nr:glutamate dehydrogenase [Gemmatimonadota bacterium]NIQ55998.1 glutamate dehydrogenase [Gemmatimonadota bacterium]NIU76196.1 glutamate dehydrogenase [Gammaproteobacteria bacterium]NIX45725.1 glutamate dehydrogenase [Gemmatimonadota bacterium]NIY10033.1 glutamate dehydrogenase [Gemmatimonadota bacterium]